MILESQSTPEGIQMSDFLREWKGQLPEAWRELATMDVIKVRALHGSSVPIPDRVLCPGKVSQRGKKQNRLR